MTLTYVFMPFTPLAVITAFSLLGNDATSFNAWIWGFSAVPLQILSSSVIKLHRSAMKPRSV